MIRLPFSFRFAPFAALLLQPAFLTSGAPAFAADQPAAPAAPAPASKCRYALLAKLPVTMEGYRASVPVTINSKQTRFWLDSGAFFSFMSQAKAVELGLPIMPLPIGFTMTGIGGSVTPSFTRVNSFGLVGNDLHNIEFVVGGSDAGNGFIGLNILAVADADYDLAHGVVNLLTGRDCSHTNLAYWASGQNLSVVRHLNGENDRDRHIYAEITVNGHKLRAMFDTGAPTSFLTRRAAEAAGIDMNAPSVVASHQMSGIGTASRESWIVRTQSFAIGTEEIRNTPIRVTDTTHSDMAVDALLGADFFLAHHILVSRGQRQIYITYNGGPIFSISTDREIGHQKTRSEVADGSTHASEPTDADGFAGRGSARITRGDMAGGLADLDKAIALAPGRVDLLESRARLLAGSGRLKEATADLDSAIHLAPGDGSLLLERAEWRLAMKDRSGALADADSAAKALPKGSLDVLPLVSLYERLNLPDKMLPLLDPAIALHKEDSQLPELLVARCISRGLAHVDLDGALADCNRAIRKGGPSARALNSRALIEYLRKDYGAAITDNNEALKIRPTFSNALYLRGLAQIASGNAGAGQEDIAAATKIMANIADDFTPFGITPPASPPRGR